MASPPSYSSPAYSPAGSPPNTGRGGLSSFSSSSQHARKRGNTSNLQDGQPSLKRRKGSTLSVSSISTPMTAHPLRQASFPPPEAESFAALSYSRSPSPDSAAPGSIVSSATTAAAQRKRGRKLKNNNGPGSVRGQTPSVAPDSGSQVPEGSQVSKGMQQQQQADSTAADPGANADADEDDEANAAADMTVTRGTDNEIQEEKMLRAMLIKNFDTEQMMRYEKWRSSKVPEAAVKRIVNATVSQSVPANVVLAVRVATKLFLGELIETARDTQTRWIAATGENQCDIPEPQPPPGVVGPEGGRRGPLRPEHIAESYAKYKREVRGGGVGVLGTWHQQTQSGVGRFSTRLGGKRRLFR